MNDYQRFLQGDEIHVKLASRLLLLIRKTNTKTNTHAVFVYMFCANDNEHG